VEVASSQFGLIIDPRARVGDLSIGQRQRVEILKCLLRTPRLLVLDEPTASLDEAEIAALLAVIGRVSAEGCAVLLITHKLEELISATQMITVLRRGKVAGRVDTAGTAPQVLAELMVGRPVSLRSTGLMVDAAPPDVVQTTAGRQVLALDGVTYRGPTGSGLTNITLDVRAGEILGIAGVEGNGQGALSDVIAGLLAPSSGRVLLNGRDVTRWSPRRRLRDGLAVIPDDARRQACVLDMSVAENLAFRDIVVSGQLNRRGILRRTALRRRAADLTERYGVSAPSIGAPMASLSGGNQQRVVLARELADPPLVLLAANPTRGLDVGGIEETNRRLAEARQAGAGILLISSELEELLFLADRIAVLHRGQIRETLGRDSATRQRVGALMAGSS
jgi:simple sugar transport system ATP-binding protein